MTKSQVSIELKYDANNGGTVIRSGISQIMIHQSVNSHHFFEVTCNADFIEDKSDTILQKSREYIGKPVKIQIADSLLICIVTEVGIKKSSTGFKGDLIIKGRSPGFIMDDRPNTQSFTNMQLKDIVSKVKRSYPGNIIHFDDGKIAPQYHSKLEYVTQYNESGFQFLRRLAADFGEWFYYDGTETYFGLPSQEHTVKLYTGSDIQNFDISMQVLHVNYKMQLYDYLKNETVNKSGGDAAKPAMDSLSDYAFNASKNLSGFSPQYINAEVYNLETPLSQVASEMVNIEAGLDASQFVMLQGSCTRSDLKLGTVIQVRERSGPDGNNEENLGDYRIIAITHTSHGQGNYQNTFKAIPKTLNSPPLPKANRPICPTQPAIVTDNNDSMGRVKVQFYWQKESNQKTPWLRVLTAQAGDKRGFLFVPEVGDEVLVCFIDNDPDQPYVAGSLYHGKAKPEGGGDNNAKGIITAGGNHIVFSDKADKQKIEIYNKKNKITLHCEEDGGILLYSEEILRFKSDKDIRFHAKGRFDVVAKEINLYTQENTDIKNTDADSQFAMTADSLRLILKKKFEMQGQQGQPTIDVKINAKEIDMNAASTLKLKADNEIDIAAKQALSVDGGQMATITAKEGLSIDGGKLAMISGKLVKIN